MEERGRHADAVLMLCREGRISCHLGSRLVAGPGEALLVPGWMTHRVEKDAATRMEVTSLAELSARARRVLDGVRLQPRVLPHARFEKLPEPDAPEPVLRAVALVHEHCLTRGAGEIAADLGYSLPYLTSLMTRVTGRSLGEWISQARLEYAAHLLLVTSHSVPEVAARCGYADTSHFRRLFKSRRGVAPSRLRVAKDPHSPSP